MPDASATAGPQALDTAFVSSLLLHPSRRALLVLDAGGRVLARNERSRGLVDRALEAELSTALANAMAQLAQHPGREVHYRHEQPGLVLECLMRAVVDAAGRIQGYTVSLYNQDEAPDLAESPDRARWRFALENAQDGLWDWDAERGEVYRSGRCFTMLGYARDAFDGSFDAWQNLIHPDDRPRVKVALHAHLAGEREGYIVDYRVRDANGKWRWILDRGRAISWDHAGRPRRVVGTHTDIHDYKQIEAQLRERERILNQAQHVAHLGNWSWDPDNDKLWWSDELYWIVGLPSHKPPPRFRHQRHLFTPESYARLHQASVALLKHGKPYAMELVMLRPNGEQRVVQARGEAILDQDGRVQSLVGVLHDVTEQRKAEETSRWRNDLLDRIAAMGRIGGFELLVGTGELHWTDENYRIHGIEPGTPLRFEDTLPNYCPESAQKLQLAFQRMVAEHVPEQTADVCYITADERRIWLRVTGRLELREGKPYRITGLTQDITEEREAGERIEQLAHYDTLTGLPNRFLFRERALEAIEAARRGGKPLALLFLDLDRFKYVNDTQGHEAGDQLLQEIAGRLRQCVRSSDLVGRLGGDEFLVLLREVARPEDAALVARKIIGAIGEPISLSNVDAQVGCSIGIALLGENAPDLEALLRAADTAMYAAKDAGRNNFQFYNSSFYERVQRRVTLEQELRQALARGEFSLAFQPTLSLADGSVACIEALLRWNAASGEHRSPAEFIPVAEECGEILPIGRWVLEQACRQARQWHEQGLSFGRIAVNVSALQLRDPEFATQVLQACARERWPSDRLVLEITESALMRDSESLRNTFALFKANGITLAIDDFGTGFSNLGYLHRFPVRTLKIDRSFVSQMDSAANMLELTHAVVSLGHALGLGVVAEGVETEKVLQLLRQQGCDEAQGYLFTRPLGGEDMATWLAAQG
ncbi:EAL domain-containing protein [Arenimonas sp. SCN 70-307]|uniref:sensor domain-containing protein n=1 Tax=Arenimonas sp. SCN 70-307 TaxID=1660089 RepID=UPI000A889A87|nr:EAL domain-containing protein [Arenimonas sp. SCN 70-307]